MDTEKRAKDFHHKDSLDSPIDATHNNTEAAILPDVAADVEKGSPPKPSTPGFDPRQNPDGGLQAWLCVLGGFCVLFCSFGWINCIGVFQEYYQTHQLSQYNPSTVSWISSLEAFFMFAGGPIIGKLYDNYGPRWLLLGGTFLHVFGLMMTSLATEYYQFLLAQGVCSPIGASMIFYPAMSTLTTWFFKKRGAAFGIIAAGSSLGGVIFPIMVQRMIVQVGFGWAMRTSAFLILALMIVANLTVKSRIPPFKKPWHFKEFVMPLKELPFDLVTFGSFLFFMGIFLPINFLILEAEYFGMKPSLAQYLVSILNAASLFGRTIPGFLADKIGRYNMMVIMCL
ncbi:MFS sugar transporter [Elasticomyces elasticus]|nr:MFS sugar transporter [Elasticomyces elasticus]